jgi:hypothetical protein
MQSAAVKRVDRNDAWIPHGPVEVRHMGNFVSVYSEDKQQLIEFAASRGSAGGAELIYSFERICAKHAEFRATVEVFLDIDTTPEICDCLAGLEPSEEVDELLVVLSRAASASRGVYVFFNE